LKTGPSACRWANKQGSSFARILLTKPKLVFLDEATSALDEVAETRLLSLLRTKYGDRR